MLSSPHPSQPALSLDNFSDGGGGMGEKKPLILEPWEATWSLGLTVFGTALICLDVQHSFSSGCLYIAKGRGKLICSTSVGPEYWNTPLSNNAKLLYLFMKHLKMRKNSRPSRENRESIGPQCFHYQKRVLKCIEMLNVL